MTPLPCKSRAREVGVPADVEDGLRPGDAPSLTPAAFRPRGTHSRSGASRPLFPGGGVRGGGGGLRSSSVSKAHAVPPAVKRGGGSNSCESQATRAGQREAGYKAAACPLQPSSVLGTGSDSGADKGQRSREVVRAWWGREGGYTRLHWNRERGGGRMPVKSLL